MKTKSLLCDRFESRSITRLPVMGELNCRQQPSLFMMLMSQSAALR